MTRSADISTETVQDGRTQDVQIADALINDIIDWRHAPGSWIREREVAQRFGVSHAPVREAFRHVAREGFVVVVPWRGVRVVEIDVATAEDVFELWKSMFSSIARLAAQRMTATEHIELMRLLESYERSVEITADPHVNTGLAYAVGRCIAEGARAPVVDENLQRVGRLALWQHGFLSAEELERKLREPGRESARRLRDLCGALVGRDSNAAARHAYDFLSVSQTYIVAEIAKRRAAAEQATPETAKPRKRVKAGATG